MEEEYLDFARATNLATMVYNPLGCGLLTGRHSFTHRPTAGRFGNSPLGTIYTERYWNPELFTAVDQLSGIADEAGLSLFELSLQLAGQPAGHDFNSDRVPVSSTYRTTSRPPLLGYYPPMCSPPATTSALTYVDRCRHTTDNQ